MTIGQCINRTLQHNWYLVNMLSSMLLWCCWGSLGVLVISQGIYVRRKAGSLLLSHAEVVVYKLKDSEKVDM